jgi:hypothetical protein
MFGEANTAHGKAEGEISKLTSAWLLRERVYPAFASNLRGVKPLLHFSAIDVASTLKTIPR